ncbi:hypothetical protein ETB97_001578 [Aspergillus alliaceus]|uniref:Uncharacterized protein n=1 Tax=Petromyces alliaceus TaxID=209559 RepID=A0A8H6AG84_PETAA|nr:hypothetical protein ETB97_001578 [Aspergillus burnettii]
MAPPTAIKSISNITVQVPQSSQVEGAEKAKVKMQMPSMPKFEDKMQEREYLNGRLAAAFRIFSENEYDEGVDDTRSIMDTRIDPSTFWVNLFGIAFS